MKYTIIRLPLAIALLAFAATATAKLFVPDLEAWSMWETSDESSDVVIEHADWQQLLDTYLVTETADGVYRFDYAGVTPADIERLNSYLKDLSSIDPRGLSRAEQLPYWINLYNALTIQVVLKHYPVKSIRKIYGGLFDRGPWDEALIEVAGQPLTLNDIEHRILRPIWRDARIHYVVNCASMGCPNLAAQAYSAENVDVLLDLGARSFINHRRAVQFIDRRLQLSSIYNWYDMDFGSNQKERFEHLQKYAEPELAAQLADYDGRIKYDYDWNLNEP